jgi:hypothetical protein
MIQLLSSGTAAKWIAVSVLSLLFCWFGYLTNEPLSGGPVRIVALELAPSVRAANGYLDAWAKAWPCDWQSRLNASLRWDTWFICAYAPLFTMLCSLAGDHFAPSRPRLAILGYALAGAQLVAGALDFVENAAMKRMIDAGEAFAPWPQVCALAAGVKWLLIIAFALYALAALIDPVLRRLPGWPT